MKISVCRTFAMSAMLLSSVAWASVDELATEYVKMVLAVGAHDPVYVDAYYGPDELRKGIDSESWPLAKIVERARSLRTELASVKSEDNLASQLRKHYLKKQITALIFHAQQLQKKNSGKPYQRDFDQEAVALYDTLPPTYDYAKFDKALQNLDALLPGDGELQERINTLLDSVTIPKDKIDIVFKRAIKGCRDNTLVSMSLPKHESFTIEYVNDKAWSGYNWYQGNANSLIQVNTDFPIRISRAVDLGCHEGYPGHHTYNAKLESELVNKRGWVELSVYPLFSPQSLIAEGSANYGIEMAYPGKAKMEFETKHLFPLAGIDPSKAVIFERYQKLAKELNYAGNEVARDYINGVISREEAIQLQAKYALEGMAKAEQRIRFVEKYGAYVINYNWGKDLVADYVRSKSNDPETRWAVFSDLLSSPRVPSSLSW